jgi:hypothetical protein
MAYTLNWTNPQIPDKASAISVPIASSVSNKASVTFTGKGFSNYGKIQQENIMHMLENFANTTAPSFATTGQLWYNSATNVLNVCTNGLTPSWKTIGGVNSAVQAPVSPNIGDLWFKPTGAASGFLYVYNAIGNNGGWAQVWPTIEIAAGREEFAYVKSLVDSMLGALDEGGAEITNVGHAAPNTYPEIVTLNDSQIVDNFGNDSNVLVGSDTSELLVDPTSNDWDMLLDAARFAISRIEAPTELANGISPVPFVVDGKQVDSRLLAFSTSSNRYPSLERRSNRRFGMVTLMRLYTETVNTLQIAVQGRYGIKGIDTSLSVNTSPHAGNTISVVFQNNNDLRKFFQSGGFIQIDATAPSSFGSISGANIGRFRISNDKVRAYDQTAIPALVAVPQKFGSDRRVSAISPSETASTALGGMTITAQRSTSSPQTTIVITLTGNTMPAHNVGIFTPADVSISGVSAV